MGEIAASSSSWRKGGYAITLEEHRRRGDIDAPKAPLRGTPIVVGSRKPKTNWRERARCVEQKLPSGYFFPDDGDFAAPSRIRAFCAGCEVSAECLMWAVLSHTKDGWYGGMSPKERRQYAPSSTRKHGTDAMYRYGIAGNDTANGCRCDECRDYVMKLNRRSRLNRPVKAGEQAK